MNLEQIKINVLNDIENEIRRVSPNLSYEYNKLEDLLRVAYRYWDKQSKIPSDMPKQMLEDSMDEFVAKYGNIIDNIDIFNWLVKNMNARSAMMYSNIQNSIAVKEDNHVRIHKICDKFNTQFTTFEQLSQYIKKLEKEYDDILLNGINVVLTESLEELSNKFGFVEDNTTEKFSELVSLLKEQEKLSNQVELHDFSGIVVTEMKEKKWFNDIKQFPSNQRQLINVHCIPTYMKYKGTHILEQCKIAADPIVVKFNLMSPTRLAIHVTNPLWGISRNTGKCSEYHILAEQIISSSTLLTEMRNAYISFREVLNGDDASALSGWISEYNSTIIKKLKTFINGLNHDIEAVRNAIKFEWTNGLVEGHVNRLKNKKREMYGRASFELLKRKVILSKTG